MSGQLIRTLKICVACLFLFSDSLLAQDTIQRTFKWEYNGISFELAMDIESKIIEYYAKLPRVINDYSYYTAVSQTHPFVPQLTNGLTQLAEDASFFPYQKLRMTIAFVQALPYTEDNGYDHPRFPAETLADNGGDCEDTSILLAAILEEMGFASVLISPKGHMGIGVACNNCNGRFFNSNGTKYFYVETTGMGWKIGQIPEEYYKKEVTITPIDRTISIETRLLDDPLAIDPDITKNGKEGEFTTHSINVKNGTAMITTQNTKLRSDGVIEVHRKRYTKSKTSKTIH